ncbi:hypothetical protein IIC65_05220 [Candidatus Sumerlaeota bacterium]|nr:hypothetical protein [Candidatus Sumerlaeota bacterium]
MNFSGPLLIFFGVAFVLSLVGAAIWVTRRASLMRADEEAEAKAFERSMTQGLGTRTLWQPPTGQENAAAAAPPDASAAPEQESSSDPAAGEIQNDDRDEEAAGIDGPEASSGQSVPASAPLPPLTEEIVAKLAAANLLESVDAPLHSPDSEVIGTGLTLRGGRRIAVIERELKKKYGDDKWWVEGIPVDIRKQCVLQREDEGCILDADSSVRNSVVLPGTYVGRSLEISDSLVDRRRIVNDKSRSHFSSPFPRHVIGGPRRADQLHHVELTEPVYFRHPCQILQTSRKGNRLVQTFA